MTNRPQWMPGASLEMLKTRAEVMGDIRSFFKERDVLEVDTPLLASTGVTDPHLFNAVTTLGGAGLPNRTYHLQTSPEYAMKRLLAAGSGCIYQIAKAVRDDEIGRLHNPEFALLEWYRIGFDDHALMNEVDALMQRILNCKPAKKWTYQELFLQHVGADPLTEEGMEHIRQWLIAKDVGDWVATEPDTDTLLQLAMSHYIEPVIGQDMPVFVYNFPASQSALARLDSHDLRVARRFELYYKGIELANGFYELTDAQQQAERFASDNAKRTAMNLPEVAVDENLLAALEHGLPDCAGVALGLDRLLMLKTEASHIEEVQTFSISRA